MGKIVRGLAIGGLALGLSGCWPAPGQGPDRTGHNPFETRISPANVATLAEQWSVFPGSGATAPITSGGTVYVTTGDLHVKAYDVGTGAEIFAVRVADVPLDLPLSDPWLMGDRVVAGWHHSQIMPVIDVGGVPVVDRRTGAVVDDIGFGPVETVRGDVVVWSATSAGPFGDLRSVTVRHLDDPGRDWGGTLQYRLFDPGTGQVEGEVSAGGLTLGADRLYQVGPGPEGTAPGQGSYNRGVRAFPVDAGQTGCGPAGRNLMCPQWVTPLAGNLTVPVVAPDQSTVYVVASGAAGTGGNVHALDTATGAIEWSGPLPAGGSGAPPALADGNLYVPTADGRLLVFAAAGCGAATCSPLWDASTGAGAAIGAQAAVAGGVVFTGSTDGRVRAFDAADCGADACPPLWSGQVSTTAGVAELAVSNGRLFVRTADGGLTTYGLP